MKKLTIFFMALLLLFCSSCADKGKNNEPPEENDPEYVTRIQTKNGRNYIEYLGEPFLLLGGQIRVDGLMNRGEGEHAPVAGAPAALKVEEIEPYIRRAAEFGLTAVELPIDWRDIEPEKDKYDFTIPDTLLSLCNKYGIKAEFLWFSTNMCGDSHSFHIPDYIWENETDYPKLDSAYDYFSWMYGYMGHLKLDSPLLMEREGKVLTALMNHVYEWNEENGKKYPLISVQIHNEPDGLVRWRSTQAELLERNGMTIKELWQMTLNALDNAGNAVKNGKYKVITRCNMTVSFSMNEFAEAPGCSPKDVYALSGIDIVGDDPYTTSASAVSELIASYNYEKNYPHIAENMGNYANTASLILSCVTSGGGYAIYDFITPQYFNYMNDLNGSTYQMDQGVLNDDFTPKAHSSDVENIVKGIGYASKILASVPLENMSGLNVEKDSPVTVFEKDYEIGGLKIGFSTQNAAKGYIFTDGSAVYFFADGESVFDFYELDTSLAVYDGKFVGSVFTENGKNYIADGKFTAEKNKLYKVELR